MASDSSGIMTGLSTEELTKSSDTVIEGRVDEVNSYWSEDGKMIFTSVSVSVKRMIRGKPVGKKVVLEYEGGEIGSIGLRVSDMSVIHLGEDVLLFLKEAKSRRKGVAHNIVGKAQGIYKIDNKGIASKKGFDLVTGRDVVDNDIPVENLIEKIMAVK